MSKQMHITIRTNTVGSDMKLPLGYTEEEWNQLSDEEQAYIALDSIADNIDYSITAE
ncbi:hypothetical protein ABLB84_06200 [Xenorhabdus szentirmaii]|uniref:DUF7167 family protein n=1 Tax=Xenorhabdus szentirmaii TaxID=290112 RepID=UPI0032B6FC22